MVDVARQHEIRPAIDDHAQLAACRCDIVAAQRMIRMFEVADVAVADAPRERHSPHHLVAFERSADPRVGAKLAEAPGGKIGGRLEVVRRRLGDQVQRSTDGIPSIQGALRSAQHLDAIEIDQLHERHRRSGEVNAVEVHRRTRIRARVHDICPNPTDRELGGTGVLRKRDGRCERRSLAQRPRAQAPELGVRDGGDRHRNRLHVAFAGLRRRDDRFLTDGNVQGEGHSDPLPRLHSQGTTRWLEPGQRCGDFVVAFGKVWKRELAGGARARFAVCDTPHRQAHGWQRCTGLVVNRAGNLTRLLCACRRRRAQQCQYPRRSTVSCRSRRCISFRFTGQWFVVTVNVIWCTPGVASRFRCAALAGLLVLGAASSEAQPVVRQVLLLQSFDNGNMTHDRLSGNFRVDLEQRAGRPVNVVQVVVGPTGFVGAPEQAVVAYIRSIFGDRPKPDLIVTLAGPATVFARRYRQQLFPEHRSCSRPSISDIWVRRRLAENETAVAVAGDFPGLIDLILQLLPQTKQVFVVLGSGQLGTFWGRELQAQFKRFEDRLTFIWSGDLSFTEILRRCASLPSHSAIFFLNFGSDAQGGAYADERVLAALHAAANAPIFGLQSVMLGTGIVGGKLVDIDELSRSTADAAIRVLDGAPPAQRQSSAPTAGSPVFDWRELQRWSIAESRLPPGSVVHYRGPTLWREYRGTVLSAAGAMVIQALLIFGLLYQRRARQRAEIESRRNLALAADANRRETMAALTSSMAHELGQPLSSMMYNAQALQMMISANQATSDSIGELLADIQAQGVRARQIIDHHRTMLRSRELDKKPIDLHSVINESLALVAHDMSARQIEAIVNVPSNPCVISGDQVLLQQVFVNLVMNAMDAMGETPPARRRITLRSDVRAADIEVSVRDTGTGVPAHIIETLFTPFVTTKSHGLGIGLTIARTIVDAHGGTLDAQNNPEGGATFTVTLRRSETPRIASGLPGAA